MVTNNKCRDWNPLESDFCKGFSPKILLIGHDPRLHSTDTIADYALFADYFFKGQPAKGSEKRKYGLAKTSFTQILEITNNRYRAEEIYVTNLCNEALKAAPPKKTVLIPDSLAKDGVERIKNILMQNRSIEFVFPMSQQVNYWLQFFGLYHTDTDFLDRAKPSAKGINNNPPYYEAIKQKPAPFLEICGNVYTLDTGQKLIPILHAKSYGYLNSNSRYESYKRNYENMTKLFLDKSL